MDELKIILKPQLLTVENCKTIVTYCGFKDIYETFKTTITNDGFIHLKKIYVDVYVNAKRLIW